MRFTKEFKLECIRKYKAGECIDDPRGCKHKTFRNKIVEWVRIYDAMGEVGLKHKKPKRPWQDKLDMIERVLGGESVKSVAISNGIKGCLLFKWCKIYQKSGID
ncbi:MAG TPA: hypothetical protein DCR94_04840 [Firmicutes bacterium]|nr:hypothetical protein [Bacillota bacterium]